MDRRIREDNKRYPTILMKASSSRAEQKQGSLLFACGQQQYRLNLCVNTKHSIHQKIL